MTIGTLVKITSAKKLMIKITQDTHDKLIRRLSADYKKKNFPIKRLATFSLESNEGETNYFVTVSLDKYDRMNMAKFESLLKKEVLFQFRLKSYDFIPEGETDQICGVNLELLSISRQRVTADPSSPMNASEPQVNTMICDDDALPAARPELKRS